MMDDSMSDQKKTHIGKQRLSGTIILSAALLLALFVLGMQLSVVRYPLARIKEAVRYPYQLDAEEGFLLAQAMRVADGTGLYLPIGERPYVVDNYPPLYPTVWSFFVNPDAPSLAPGRAIAALGEFAVFVAILMMALAVVLTYLHDLQLSDRLRWVIRGFIFVLATGEAIRFTTSVEVLRWSAYARVDMPAIGLTVLGLVLFFFGDSVNPKRRTMRALRVAGFMLMLLAVLTKQTALAAPAACMCWLCWRREWKRGLKYAFAGAGVLIIITLVFTLLTKGQYWLHTVTYNRNVMNWAQLHLELRGLWRQHFPLIIIFSLLALALMFFKIFARNKSRESSIPERKPTVLFSFYLLFNLLSLVSLAKAGAAENYKIEVHAAVALFVINALSSLMVYTLTTHRKLFSWGAGVACLLTLALLSLYSYPSSFGRMTSVYYYYAPRPTYFGYTKGQSLVNAIRSTPGDVLCEDPIYLLHAGKPIFMQNFIMSQLSKEGRWDDSLVTGPMREGKVPLVIAYADLRQEGFYPRYTRAILDTVRNHYSLAGIIKASPADPAARIIPTFYIFQYAAEQNE